MKVAFSNINKAFEGRVKLGIMSVLAVNSSLDFKSIKEFLDVTDGNLAGHIKALEKEAFITTQKSFIGRMPNTRYSITTKGKEAFSNHLKALETIIKAQQ